MFVSLTMPGPSVNPPSQRSSLPFNPKPSHRVHTPLFNEGFTPRFLYRLVNLGTSVRAHALPDNTQDIFNLPSSQAAAALLKHIQLQRGYEDGCNLTTWTSSLLFALQCALRQYSKAGNDLSPIYLLTLDTNAFPSGTFIQEMEIMRAFQDADIKLPKLVELRESEYYFGEYLTQGALQLGRNSTCTSVQQMIQLGLFDLQPALADQEQSSCWPKRVLNLRSLFEEQKAVPITDGDVEVAVNIAQNCFGGQWVVPAIIMLLALQPRNRDDQAIIRGFKSRYTLSEVKSTGLHRMRVDTKRLPEVRQFKVLVELIQNSYGFYDCQPLVDSVQDLNI
ncbi:hypothetical protein BJX99DRAFT_105346 [Aspergillus californicus]